jgi:uncharacterized protein YodC (DUF2158 family)
MSKFSVGDVVALNSGGEIHMTVARIESKEDAEQVTCVYVARQMSATSFGSSAHLDTRTLDARMLVLVNAAAETRMVAMK